MVSAASSRLVWPRFQTYRFRWMARQRWLYVVRWPADLRSRWRCYIGRLIPAAVLPECCDRSDWPRAGSSFAWTLQRRASGRTAGWNTSITGVRALSWVAFRDAGERFNCAGRGHSRPALLAAPWARRRTGGKNACAVVAAAVCAIVYREAAQVNRMFFVVAGDDPITVVAHLLIWRNLVWGMPRSRCWESCSPTSTFTFPEAPMICLCSRSKISSELSRETSSLDSISGGRGRWVAVVGTMAAARPPCCEPCRASCPCPRKRRTRGQVSVCRHSKDSPYPVRSPSRSLPPFLTTRQCLDIYAMHMGLRRPLEASDCSGCSASTHTPTRWFDRLRTEPDRNWRGTGLMRPPNCFCARKCSTGRLQQRSEAAHPPSRARGS